MKVEGIKWKKLKFSLFGDLYGVRGSENCNFTLEWDTFRYLLFITNKLFFKHFILSLVSNCILFIPV